MAGVGFRGGVVVRQARGKDVIGGHGCVGARPLLSLLYILCFLPFHFLFIQIQIF